MPKSNNGVRFMSKLRSLSLVLAGVILGIGISYSSEIQAAANKLLGSKVSNVLNVKINKKSIGSGAVINGTTYVPLRAAATSLGLEVTKVDSNEVTLDAVQIVDNTDDIRMQIDAVNKEIGEVNLQIKNAQDVNSNKKSIEESIQSKKEWITELTRLKQYAATDTEKNSYQSRIDQTQNQIEQQTKLLSDAESSLPVLQQKLTELQDKKSKLEAQLQK